MSEPISFTCGPAVTSLLRDITISGVRITNYTNYYQTLYSRSLKIFSVCTIQLQPKKQCSYETQVVFGIRYCGRASKRVSYFFQVCCRHHAAVLWCAPRSLSSHKGLYRSDRTRRHLHHGGHQTPQTHIRSSGPLPVSSRSL